MADKIDPFDVAALEKSLNDSATRVSAIWVSYLIFGLYLVVAAGNVSHRQLFLEEPIRLPVLNIDLPLVGFFLLAPVLFVIFHAYVLIQVVLLARTAATYNEAVNNNVENDADNARVRQRLAKTLFAQIFAGSPRERTGALGWLLQAMAWITLAIAPVLILLTFQFMFLPYHSHLATWTHRLLIVIELAAVLVLWPLALNSKRDLGGSTTRRRMRRAVRFRTRLWWPRHQRRLQWKRLRHNATIFLACLLLVLIAYAVATFPGEPHVNLATGHSWGTVYCDRWHTQQFDRLKLPRVDVVDDERLAKIAAATAARGQRPYQGERTRSFRDRDLSCGDFSGADLRRVDLTDAKLLGAFLNEAELIGASLKGANLHGASLNDAQLQSADLTGAYLEGAMLDAAKLQGAVANFARLQGVDLDYAQMQGASFDRAELQGAALHHAQLQGANLGGAQLQGALLNDAQLQGAYLGGAQLQGASLNDAQMQGASLEGARLQGASLLDANLQGASLGGSWLQGANLQRSNLALSLISNTMLWRAIGADCTNSDSVHRPRVIDPQFDAVIDFDLKSFETIKADRKSIDDFIERSLTDVPDHRKSDVRIQMAAQLHDNPDEKAAWEVCVAITSRSKPALDDDHLSFLRGLACDGADDRKVIAEGIIRNWISSLSERLEFSAGLARALLDGNACGATGDLHEATKKRLYEAVQRPSRDSVIHWDDGR